MLLWTYLTQSQLGFALWVKGELAWPTLLFLMLL